MPKDNTTNLTTATSTLPLNVGTLHFVGIGGIGMSGIAEVLHNLGYDVQGSELNESAITKRLQKLGIKVEIGHRAENIGDAYAVVASSAVPRDNPELQAARARHIPIVRRAEMLAQLMRLKLSIAVAGTHGKTTTTSLMAAILDSADKDPTVINGGIINAYGTNARLGKGEWIVVEADESDGTFVKLPATVAIVTNIDAEHMEHFQTLEALQQAFTNFVTNIPFYGFALLCIDHPNVQKLVADVRDRRIITYGFSPQADVRADNITADETGMHFEVLVRGRLEEEHTSIGTFHLAMHGQHNVQNALATIGVARTLDIPVATIRKALSSFGGVKRRFTKTGEVAGITIIDDYAHHPVEVAAVLKAARDRSNGQGRTIAVVQPHRYTRLRDLMEGFCTCFNDADTVIVADVYAAGEEPIEGVSQQALIDGLKRHGHRHVEALGSPEALPALIKNLAQPGDLVVCMGAGSITYWANALPDQLAALFPSNQNNGTAG